MDKPCLLERLRLSAPTAVLGLDSPDVTYFIGKESFLATSKGEMGRWSESLFAFLHRNAGSATAYFGLPPERVMELGVQIDL